MANTNKFKIAGLNINSKYKSAAPLVLHGKLRSIYKEIDKFFINDSPENLHSLRIAFRRFRYVMEVFYECIDPGLFKYIYHQTKRLQDLIGEGRDLDVMEIKFGLIENRIRKKIPNYVYQDIFEEKTKMRRIIKTELINFIVDKDINKIFLNK